MLSHRPGMTASDEQIPRKAVLTIMPSQERHHMWRLCGGFPASVVFKSFTLFRTFHSLSPAQASPNARVETIRLTHADKNAWAEPPCLAI
jgi:hypothetical protein